ncbi:MAG TPA: glycosyltransferase family 4 protein [Dongiaceae bacterium]|nr:glycosyltransferase family 4 protein [Dongiaceae bacterium]
MKVCLIAPVPPFRGGIAKYCYSLAQELEKRHDLLLLSYKRQYPEILYGRKSQVDPECDARHIRNEFSQLSYDIDSASIPSWLATSKKIAAFDPDLVILPWWVTYWAPMYACLLASLKKKGIKVVFLCINIFEHEDNWLKKLATKFVLRRVGAIIVHSEQEKGVALEINPGATVKKHLLPIFMYDAKQTNKKITGLNLLFFGFVRPYKGLDTLLKAVGILKDYDISLRIAGEFWNGKAEYLSLVGELGISDKVEIIDRYIPDDEMTRYFSWADLVVLPYKQTITSGIIATAYGFGKPVLATSVGGFHEIVKEGYTGKLVSPDDPQSFADGIVWFLNNRHIDFEENIGQFTSQIMSWKSLVDTIEEFKRV